MLVVSLNLVQSTTKLVSLSAQPSTSGNFSQIMSILAKLALSNTILPNYYLQYSSNEANVAVF